MKLDSHTANDINHGAAVIDHGTAVRLNVFLVSSGIAAPAIIGSIVLMQWEFNLADPGMWMMGILGFTALNLLVTLLLEPYTSRIGPFTMPAILATIALVLLYLITEALNRFAEKIGYEWLLPFVLAGLCICYTGIFRERSVVLRLYMALNGLMLTLLWCMGVADKVSLPF